MLKNQKVYLDSISNENLRKRREGGLSLKSATTTNDITFDIENVKNTGTATSPRYNETVKLKASNSIMLTNGFNISIGGIFSAETFPKVEDVACNPSQ